MSPLVSRLKHTISGQINAFQQIQDQSVQWFRLQSTLKQVLLSIAAVVGAIAGVLVLIFHKYVIQALVTVADYWHELPYGRVLLFTLIFFVGFPPLIGYSALSMLCGMVYGFPGGWPLLAGATVLGSLAAFFVYRFLLRSYAERLVNHNERFRAFSEILKEDASLLLLMLLRLCPLPYSLSNGALAAIPNLSATQYFLASVITSPKMFIHIFVGHSIKNLGDTERPALAKIIDVVSIVVTGVALSTALYIIYNRMQQKLDTYHRPGNDDLIFGNFDDLESGPTVELDAGDFDEDNFIIGDDDELDALQTSENTGAANNRGMGQNRDDAKNREVSGSADPQYQISPHMESLSSVLKQRDELEVQELDIDDELDDFVKPSKGYRDY